MSLYLKHTEYADATPESVWELWSDLSTWAKWDNGIEWCKLKEGSKFEVNGEALLLPKGAPSPMVIRFIECTVNKSFTDEGCFELGCIQFSHKVVIHDEGIQITHSLKYKPINPKTQEIFEKQMFSKIKKELPESVKNLAKYAEKKCSERRNAYL